MPTDNVDIEISKWRRFCEHVVLIFAVSDHNRYAYFMTTLYNSVPSIASLHACVCCLFEMSILDFLNIEKFKLRIRVDTQHSQCYISKESTPEKAVILTAHLPYEGLREWYEARQKCLSQNISCKYVEIFNLFLFKKTGMKIKDITMNASRDS